MSAAQQSMMALGGAIGTGLFLASGLSVNIAGPAVVLSYLIVAGVSILIGRALTERWIPDLRSTLMAGAPWLALLAGGYYVSVRTPL